MTSYTSKKVRGGSPPAPRFRRTCEIYIELNLKQTKGVSGVQITTMCTECVLHSHDISNIFVFGPLLDEIVTNLLSPIA